VPNRRKAPEKHGCPIRSVVFGVHPHQFSAKTRIMAKVGIGIAIGIGIGSRDRVSVLEKE